MLHSGLSAFGLVTADGAALGFSAFGSTDEAGALGLIRFGPVWAGAEPGIGTYTPCAAATSRPPLERPTRGSERARSGPLRSSRPLNRSALNYQRPEHRAGCNVPSASVPRFSPERPLRRHVSGRAGLWFGRRRGSGVAGPPSPRPGSIRSFLPRALCPPLPQDGPRKGSGRPRTAGVRSGELGAGPSSGAAGTALTSRPAATAVSSAHPLCS